MVIEPPQEPGQPKRKPSPANNRPQKPTSSKPRKIITVGVSGGGGVGSKVSGGDSSEQPPKPSPWLNPDNVPKPHATASFVEYLRWMRSPDSDYKDATKVQMLQIAEQGANYCDRLTELTNRTKLIAGEENTFQVKCPWRIRVGGHRGPESILLPAFDALGMPYIPSSTLRGVARTQAIRHFMADGMTWQQATKEIAPYFGSLEAKNPCDRAGKVIFLDAYPLPSQVGVLAVDMANNIWNWAGESLPYSPNPNPFFSLKEPTFLIGLRRTPTCDEQTFNHVRDCLIKGLQSGIGSQVNTGYGELIRAGKINPISEFLRLDFIIKGQLIHGCQKFRNVNQPFQAGWNGNLRPDTTPEAEVRSVAFKSMLRYWFRTFALGVLPARDVQQWEVTLFGSIKPQKWAWVKFNVVEGQKPRSNGQSQNDPCLQQEGVLTLTYSSEAPKDDQATIAELFKNLTWLMFQLGGIGQGARRPCYFRQNSQYPPWYRGSTLTPDRHESFWQLPPDSKQFQQLFQKRLQDFYAALTTIAGKQINPRSPLIVGQVTPQQWREVVDRNCRIIVCSGDENFHKPYALAVLHDPQFKHNNNYDGNLCGKVAGGVKPSPVWIADLGSYQVVTVFGATEDPRKKYLRTLSKAQSYSQLWPLL